MRARLRTAAALTALSLTLGLAAGCSVSNDSPGPATSAAVSSEFEVGTTGGNTDLLTGFSGSDSASGSGGSLAASKGFTGPSGASEKASEGKADTQKQKAEAKASTSTKAKSSTSTKSTSLETTSNSGNKAVKAFSAKQAAKQSAKGKLGRLVVPKLGVNAPIKSMAASGGVLDPGDYTSAWNIANYGSTAKADDGTDYLAFHSGRPDKYRLGNLFMDRSSGKSTLSKGDRVFVDGKEYKVIRTLTPNKRGIAAEKDVWVNDSDRLVLITCLQREGFGSSVDNSIAITERIK